MSTVPLSGVNSRFLAPSRFPVFHVKYPAFLAYFDLEKMRSMRSFQRQVKELRRLGNQLPVLRKANWLSKIVKCVFCLFVNLRLSPHRVGPGIKISRVILARAKSVYRLDEVLYQLCPLAVGKPYYNSRFLRFFVRSVPLFRSLMLTPMLYLQC